MTSVPQHGSPDELLGQVIRVLTAAARLTRPVLERDEQASELEGRPVWKDSGRREPADWAAFVAQALAGAAANVGGVENVLAGRPGSWEADCVRQLLLSTVGYDSESLWEHRTEPLIVDLWVDVILSDLGVWATYDAAEQELQRKADAAGGPTFRTGEPTTRVWTEEEETAWSAVQDELDRLAEQRERDWVAYGDALVQAVLAEATRRGITVAVEVVLHDDWPDREAEREWSLLTSELCEAATRTVPLPGAGLSPLERLLNGAGGTP